MDPFTQRMLERAKARREKLDTQLSNAGHDIKRRSPLKDTNTILAQATTSYSTSAVKEISKTSSETMKPPINVSPYMVDIENNKAGNKENKKNGINAAKSKLQKLGKLYADDGDHELSSPIHRTEERFTADEDCTKYRSSKKGARLDRLAALASTINNWEDDLSHPTLVKQVNTKAEKIQAKFNEQVKNSESEPSSSLNSSIQECKKITQSAKQIRWDKTMLEILEAQGFSRTKSNSRLVYDYKDCSQETNVDPSKPLSEVYTEDKQDVESKHVLSSRNKQQSGDNIKTNDFPNSLRNDDQKNLKISEKLTVSANATSNSSRTLPKFSIGSSPKDTTHLCGSVLSKASMFESKSNDIKGKDPIQMTLSERKALFERNKGQAPLIPKAPLAMSIPPKMLQKKEKSNSPLDSFRSSVNINKTVSAQRAVFEQGGCVQELENNILRNTHIERQRELDIIRSRFNRNKEVVQAAAGSCIRTSESSEGKSNSPKNSPVCPVKPTPAPDHVTVLSSPPPPPPPPPPLPLPPPPPSSSSSSSLLIRSHNDKNILRQSSRSPVEKPETESAESNIDVGYPIDVKESEMATFDENTGTETSTEADYYAEGESINVCSDDEMNTSLGKSILRVVNRQALLNKKRSINLDSDSNTSDISVLEEMDEYLDEYLAVQEENSKDLMKHEGPTPPKLNKGENAFSTSSSSFKYNDMSIYRSPIKCVLSTERPKKVETYIVEDDNCMPLMHSVSFYRRQQSQTLKIPVCLVSKKPECINSDAGSTVEDDNHEVTLVQNKMKQLLDEVCKQQTIIGQASQALNLCSSTIEFNGSREQVEGERLLLLATHRRQAALNEMQRLKVEGTLRPITPGSPEVQGTGSLIVSAITIPLKPEFSRNMDSNACLHFVCLLRHMDNVMATPVIVAESGDSCIRFPSTLKIENLYSDFKIAIEVYTLQTQAEVLPHEIKYHIHNTGNSCSSSSTNIITNKKSTVKTPKKFLKHESRLVMPNIQSPAGPSAVRSPAFSLAGYVIFSLKEVHRQQFTLNKLPRQSPLEGRLQMHVSCELSVLVEYRGFLTMFEDISGFGAWHRRWCLLKGAILSYWKYPDDERKKPPIGSLDLQSVVTKDVKLVSRDICARPHTFLLETIRAAKSSDVDSLIMIRNGSETTIRYLLSADTKEDRLEWCSKLNKTLNLIHAWGGSLATS